MPLRVICLLLSEKNLLIRIHVWFKMTGWNYKEPMSPLPPVQSTDTREERGSCHWPSPPGLASAAQVFCERPCSVSITDTVWITSHSGIRETISKYCLDWCWYISQPRKPGSSKERERGWRTALQHSQVHEVAHRRAQNIIMSPATSSAVNIFLLLTLHWNIHP